MEEVKNLHVKENRVADYGGYGVAEEEISVGGELDQVDRHDGLGGFRFDVEE